MNRKRSLLFILIILLVGISGFYLYSDINSLPPLNTWPTYQGNGYSLRYPPGMDVRQSGDDLLVEAAPVSTLIFIDPFRYPFSPTTQNFSEWYTQYLSKQQKIWEVEKTGIQNLTSPVKLSDNKYQITFLAREFANQWQLHKRTFLITGDHIVILTWRPLPKSFTDPYSFNKSISSEISYQITFNRQAKAYDVMVSTFLPTSASPQANIYTSPVYQNQYYRLTLPAGWVANPFSEYAGYAPLNNTLGVEFYQPAHKEWTWADTDQETRVQVKFIEPGVYLGPLDTYPDILNHPGVQFITNHNGVPLANLTDGRVLLNFPKNSICIFQLSYTDSEEIKEEFNHMVMNLEILSTQEKAK